MDSLSINLNVSLALNEQTKAFLSGLADKLMASLTVAANPTVLREAAASQPDEQPAAEAPAPAEPAAPAMPMDDLPVSKADLRKAVIDARQRGVTVKAVKAIFAEFGIASSIDCPDDRAEELYNRLQTA